MRLRDKVALVTGGGTGIGRACSLALAKEGAAVAVNYSRSKADAEATAADIRKAGGAAVAVAADVSSDMQVNDMIGRVVADLGRLDILVNNAATTRFIAHDQLDELTEEIWDRIFDVNVKGMWFCSRSAFKVMKKHGWGGSITNIASIAGLTGNGSSIAYCASKAAVLTLTKSLARAFAPQVRVNVVSPGFIESRWTAEQHVAREKNKQNTPMKRNGTPEDISAAVMYLVTAADWVTGENLVVDGGRML
jgi:3-oxoacyl-[acyl-carrier protein] reductase